MSSRIPSARSASQTDANCCRGLGLTRDFQLGGDEAVEAVPTRGGLLKQGRGQGHQRKPGAIWTRQVEI